MSTEPSVQENKVSQHEEFSIRWRADNGNVWFDHATTRARAQDRLRDDSAPSTGELVRRSVLTTEWWPTPVKVAGQPTTTWAIGCASDGTGLHAVNPLVVDSTFHWSTDVPAECGRTVRIAQDWGVFERGNEKVDRLGACVRCAWTVAVATGTTNPELAALVPASVAEHDALMRLLLKPFLFLDICRKLLADMEDEAPDGRFVQLLTAATEHRPIVLLDGLCSEDSCDHDEKPADCWADADTVACGACTISAGSWAGEYEGYTEVLIPAEECPVLPGMAKALGVVQAVAS